jgi:hypothetical protein
MIKLKFSKWCKTNNFDILEFNTYKEFFEFFIKNYQKGCIHSVEDDGDTK